MKVLRAVLLVVAAFTLAAQDSADLNAIYRIKNEAFRKGKVVEHLATLTDRYGPRLTASREYDAAAEWTLTQFKNWGLANAHLEKWGPWGRAWSLKRFSAHMTAPEYLPLIGFPLAWSDSTSGTVSGEPVYLPLRDNDIERLKGDIARIKKEQAGKLKGKIIMMTQLRPMPMQLQPPGKRYTDADLTAQAAAIDPTPPRQFDFSKLAMPEDPEERSAFYRAAPRALLEAIREQRTKLRSELNEWFRKEGVAGILMTDSRGDGGTVFGESAGWWDARFPPPLPTFAITPEHYGRIQRLTGKKTPVTIEFEVKAEISAKNVEPSNVVAEIPGGARAEEVVLVGAHLDSWVGGTGATDNATGCAVVMEAVRILKALNLKLDRTVRVVLWSGEEQGLLGSREYVKQHYGDPATMQIKPDQEKVFAYFNLDNGSGKIRGVYLQGNDAARPVFEAWLAPFKDLGVTTITIRNTGGTDHQSFDAVGIPGFQFIQDPLEYMSRTHHSNMDTFERAQASDLLQSSAVMASVIYHAANRPAMMPRKPLPEPEPKWTPPATISQ